MSARVRGAVGAVSTLKEMSLSAGASGMMVHPAQARARWTCCFDWVQAPINSSNCYVLQTAMCWMQQCPFVPRQVQKWDGTTYLETQRRRACHYVHVWSCWHLLSQTAAYQRLPGVQQQCHHHPCGALLLCPGACCPGCLGSAHTQEEVGTCQQHTGLVPRCA
jgi:hypothetical protein